jgi:hypothetical protein
MKNKNFPSKNISNEFKILTSEKSKLLIEKHNLKTSYNVIVAKVNKVIFSIKALDQQDEKLVKFD